MQQQNARAKYLFVVNPGSGADDNKKNEELISEFLKDENSDGEIYKLPKDFEFTQIKDRLLHINPENVIAVGGDGTVTMMANIISGKDITLGIIPAGSANGMAKELGIPTDGAEALALIKNGTKSKCDLIRINGKDLCLHMSDIGLNAHLIKHFDAGKLRGQLGYAKVILKTLWEKEKMQVILKTRNEEIHRNAFMVALANARKYGTGAVLNPEGKTDDGLFEVIIVRKLSIIALLKMLFKPGMFNPKHIEIFPCTSVRINTLRKVHFQIDGEYKGRVKNVNAEIVSGAIDIILPDKNENNN